MGTADFFVTSSTPVPEPATLRNRQFSVTGKPVVSTGFEAGFLPLSMGTTDSSVTGNTPEPATLRNGQHSGTSNTQEPVIL